MLRRRPQLLWLLVPFVLFLGAVPLVNRVRPVLLGLPFLFLWMIAATLLTPLAVWLTHRADRRAGRGAGGSAGRGADQRGGRR
ncbi:DUF3311 domain-containing protein [Streptomyces sp. NBC_01306]|uniref:DUF3311 domain-containing protein n=1 Tax=Streptomyces sp. NBC_01306 TaxID=2903819 RepID=UPI00225BCDDE|nr:DUF3311 domain-containing protein [Streptomyces sp. NBC_01306]MCX4726376.1 DUF3311 domain-containing protein [Streptomyces sp. NBC_01306]